MAPLKWAGPNTFYLDGLIQRALGARNDPRDVIADPHARYFGTELNERSLVPGDEAELGEIRFDDWLGPATAGPRIERVAAQGERIPHQRSAAWIGVAGRRCGSVQHRGRFLRHPGEMSAQAGTIE